MGKAKKNRVSILLVTALVLSLIALAPDMEAATVPKLSSKQIRVKVGVKRTVKVHSSIRGRIKATSLNPIVATVAKQKKTVKKGKPASFVVKGKYTGYAIFNIDVKLRKAVRGTKEYHLSLDVYVDEKTNPTPTPQATMPPGPSGTPQASGSPSSTPTASPTSTPTPTIISTSTPVPTVKPSAVPTPTAAAPTDQKEREVYDKIIAMKEIYPEGKPFTDDNVYYWDGILGTNVRARLRGCIAFAAILSDAAFGERTSAREIKFPSASDIRVGDIIRINNDTHSVIVLSTEGDYFTIAEGNFNYSVHWGRRIPKTTTIYYYITRW